MLTMNTYLASEDVWCIYNNFYSAWVKFSFSLGRYSIGGEYSHEFQCSLSQVRMWWRTVTRGYAANIERAESMAEKYDEDETEKRAMMKFATPDAKTIDDLGAI